MLILCLIDLHDNDVLIHVLMMYDDMHNVVNVDIMHVFVNGLFYGLECEHMSILELLLMLHC